MIWPYLLAAFILGGSLGFLIAALAMIAGQSDARADNARDAHHTTGKLDAWEDMIRSGAPLSRVDQLGLIEAVRHYSASESRARAEAMALRDAPDPERYNHRLGGYLKVAR